MEPCYVGPNQHIDAMAVAWLFANDYVFFNPDEIAWDGSRHIISGMQINAAKVDEIPDFMDNPQMYAMGIGDLLQTLEDDEQLVVPRSKIHPALHEAIREGDLTAITLFNLQACARAFAFINGLDTHDIPDGIQNAYTVAIDQRLTRGIPNFYGLLRRLIHGMRTYNGLGEIPFMMTCISTINLDANVCIGQVDALVEGAVSESVYKDIGLAEPWSEEDVAAFMATREASTTDDDECEDEPPNNQTLPVDETPADFEESEAERAMYIAALRLAILGNELTGSQSIPQDLVDELDRAENGDTSIDLEDLARRIYECLPQSQAVDVASITFDSKNMAYGSHFSLQVPDNWTVINDFKETSAIAGMFAAMGNANMTTRPFVAVYGDADAQDDLSSRDRIIYCAANNEPLEMFERFGTDDLIWAIRWQSLHDKSDEMGMFKRNIAWETEVEATNTNCYVAQYEPQNDGANGFEINVFPYAEPYGDYLRFVFSYSAEETDVEALRDMVVKMAQTIKLNQPNVPECEQLLAKAMDKQIGSDKFTEMVRGFAVPFLGSMSFRQSIFTAAQYKYVSETDDFDEDECTRAGAQGIATLCNRGIPRLERLMDAYERQAALGTRASELEEMLLAIEWFNDSVFPTSEIFGDADARMIEMAGIFDPTPELEAARERLARIKRGITTSSEVPVQIEAPCDIEPAASIDLSGEDELIGMPREPRPFDQTIDRELLMGFLLRDLKKSGSDAGLLEYTDEPLIGAPASDEADNAESTPTLADECPETECEPVLDSECPPAESAVEEERCSDVRLDESADEPDEARGVHEEPAALSVSDERAAAERRERLIGMTERLQGTPQDIYLFIRHAGGSVSAATLAELKGLSCYRDELYAQAIANAWTSQGILVKVEEAHPVEGGAVTQRFYTWEQVDDAGSARFDNEAYRSYKKFPSGWKLAKTTGDQPAATTSPSESPFDSSNDVQKPGCMATCAAWIFTLLRLCIYASIVIFVVGLIKDSSAIGPAPIAISVLLIAAAVLLAELFGKLSKALRGK